MGAAGGFVSAAAGLAGGILGGSSGQASESVERSQTRPVIIPRQPPVIPQLRTGQGSRINVGATFGAGTPTATTAAPTGSRFAVQSLGEDAGQDEGPQGFQLVDTGITQSDAGAALVADPGAPSLLGLDIDVALNPEIAERRGQLDQDIEGIKSQVQGTITGIQQQIENINNLQLPEVDEARFDQIAELGDQQRGQLLGIDQELGGQISALEDIYRRLGENSNVFAEARTRGLMESREKARRDASRRGISGPLAALATNPIDTQIADERSKAVQEVQDAQLRVREQQRLLQQTRLQVQQQFEQVRQGELTAVSEKFRQADERFGAGVSKAATAAGLEQMVQGGAELLRTLSSDQSGLNQQALVQELSELGLANEVFQMIVNSQLVTPTAQTTDSFGQTVTEGGGDRWGDLWSHLKDFSQESLLKGGIFEPTLAHNKFILED